MPFNTCIISTRASCPQCHQTLACQSSLRVVTLSNLTHLRHDATEAHGCRKAAETRPGLCGARRWFVECIRCGATVGVHTEEPGCTSPFCNCVSPYVFTPPSSDPPPAEEGPVKTPLRTPPSRCAPPEPVPPSCPRHQIGR
jgi:hypothetical protein